MLFFWAALWSGLCGAAQASGFTPTGAVHDPGLSEISGLAPSRRQPGVYWAHNDSRNPALLYAIAETGAVVARVTVKGASNLDWEDLVSYQDNGQALLALADIGNNLGLDADLTIYVLPEPAPGDTEVSVLRRHRFRYADGPRDAEGLAVDLAGRRFLIVDKGRRPASLYALPMDGYSRRAERIAQFMPPSPPAVAAPLEAGGVDRFTAMDLSGDGRELLLLTYRHLLRFVRGPQEDWQTALARAPRQKLRLPAQRGFEALCWSADGREALLTHEGLPAQLYRWRPAAP